MKVRYCILLVFLAGAAYAQGKIEVFFGFGEDVPTETSARALAEWIAKNPDATVSGLNGYCDSIDSDSYNKQLAARRIQNVLKTLENSGAVILDDVVLKSVGEDFELSADAAQNRRVDILYNRQAATVSAETKNDKKREETFDGQNPAPSLESQFQKAKIGDVIRVKNINFYLNSEVVVPESEPRLLELYQSMVSNPRLIIEIQGHICCNPDINDTKLSFRRAKYIFTYLIDKGIPVKRLAYKGFGSSRPIHRIPEKSPQEMAENRRVEIKIIKI